MWILWYGNLIRKCGIRILVFGCKTTLKILRNNFAQTNFWTWLFLCDVDTPSQNLLQKLTKKWTHMLYVRCVYFYFNIYKNLLFRYCLIKFCENEILAKYSAVINVTWHRRRNQAQKTKTMFQHTLDLVFGEIRFLDKWRFQN